MKRLPFPSVPASVSPELRLILSAVRDSIEQFASGGMRRAVTFDDLVALGLVSQADAEARAKVRA